MNWGDSVNSSFLSCINSDFFGTDCVIDIQFSVSWYGTQLIIIVLAFWAQDSAWYRLRLFVLVVDAWTSYLLDILIEWLKIISYFSHNLTCINWLILGREDAHLSKLWITVRLLVLRRWISASASQIDLSTYAILALRTKYELLWPRNLILDRMHLQLFGKIMIARRSTLNTI